MITAPPGFGWRYDADDQLAHEPHDPQPHADGDGGLHHVRARLHPGRARPRPPACTRSRRRGWTRSAAPTPCSTPSAAGTAATAASPTRTRRRTPRGPTRWVVPEDGALVGAAGHLHPGGLYTDLKLTRDGRTVPLFRSRGEVLRARGRRLVGRGDDGDPAATGGPACARATCVSVSGTYDTRRASWYESMAIMPADVRPRRGRARPVHHGRQRARRGHARAPARERQPRRRPLLRPARPAQAARAPGPRRRRRGRHLRLRLRPGRPELHRPARPSGAVERGKRLTFVNRDARRRPNVFHTITACKAPCNRETGIAYPLANGPVDFDSGELGFGPAGSRRRPTATAGRRRSASSRGPTRTSAACTRSCAGAFEVKKGR